MPKIASDASLVLMIVPFMSARSMASGMVRRMSGTAVLGLKMKSSCFLIATVIKMEKRTIPMKTMFGR